MMNKEERVLNVINRKPVDYLPSQITFSDRTRDKEVSEALGLSAPSDLDGYLENHIAITLTLHDKALFFRNDEEFLSLPNLRDYCRCELIRDAPWRIERGSVNHWSNHGDGLCSSIFVIAGHMVTCLRTSHCKDRECK